MYVHVSCSRAMNVPPSYETATQQPYPPSQAYPPPQPAYPAYPPDKGYTPTTQPYPPTQGYPPAQVSLCFSVRQTIVYIDYYS